MPTLTGVVVVTFGIMLLLPGDPALVLPTGFSSAGLPLSMERDVDPELASFQGCNTPEEYERALAALG